VVNKEVEQQFWQRGGMTLQLLGKGETYNRNSLHVNILGKAAVLHFALTPFCGWGYAHPSLQTI
jgi:hypothetical protein